MRSLLFGFGLETSAVDEIMEIRIDEHGMLTRVYRG